MATDGGVSRFTWPCADPRQRLVESERRRSGERTAASGSASCSPSRTNQLNGIPLRRRAGQRQLRAERQREQRCRRQRRLPHRRPGRDLPVGADRGRRGNESAAIPLDLDGDGSFDHVLHFVLGNNLRSFSDAAVRRRRHARLAVRKPAATIVPARQHGDRGPWRWRPSASTSGSPGRSTRATSARICSPATNTAVLTRGSSSIPLRWMTSSRTAGYPRRGHSQVLGLRAQEFAREGSRPGLLLGRNVPIDLTPVTPKEGLTQGDQDTFFKDFNSSPMWSTRSPATRTRW